MLSVREGGSSSGFTSCCPMLSIEASSTKRTFQSVWPSGSECLSCLSGVLTRWAERALHLVWRATDCTQDLVEGSAVSCACERCVLLASASHQSFWISRSFVCKVLHAWLLWPPCCLVLTIFSGGRRAYSGSAVVSLRHIPRSSLCSSLMRIQLLLLLSFVTRLSGLSTSSLVRSLWLQWRQACSQVVLKLLLQQRTWSVLIGCSSSHVQQAWWSIWQLRELVSGLCNSQH